MFNTERLVNMVHWAQVSSETSINQNFHGKWFESRDISCLSSMIIRVRTVFRLLLVTDVLTT